MVLDMRTRKMVVQKDDSPARKSQIDIPRTLVAQLSRGPETRQCTVFLYDVRRRHQ